MSIKLLIDKFKLRSQVLAHGNIENDNNGFTIIELAAVVAILTILSSLTISNVTKWVKLSNINQAKSVVDNTIVECLQSMRDTGDLPQNITISSNIIDNSRLNTLGYKLKSSENVNCGDLSLIPVSESESLLYEFGFNISNNNVNKIASPADDQSSLGSCKAWAGANCGVSEEQLALWAAEQLLAEQKAECLNDYASWLTGPPRGTGSNVSWNESAGTCDLPVFAFEGNLVADQAAVDAALDAQRSGICNGIVNQYRTQNYNGAVPISECQTDEMSEAPTYFFCDGVEQNSLALMNTCLANNIVGLCEAARNAALGVIPDGNHMGPYQPSTSGDVPNNDGGWPVECTQITYMCKGSEYGSADASGYVTNCGNVDPPPPPPPAYGCNSGGEAQAYTQCCPPSWGGIWCRSSCGPEGSNNSSSGCSGFNSCSCFNP